MLWKVQIASQLLFVDETAFVKDFTCFAKQNSDQFIIP